MLEDCLAVAARGQESAVLLKDGPLDVVEIDLRITLAGLCCTQLVKIDAGFAKQRQGGLFLLVSGAGHPQHTGVMEELAVPALLVFLPQLKRPHRHGHKLVFRPVRCANDARLTAGAGAGIPRPPRIE